ncbi:ERI1 exoribonuclease 2 [Portunus trituberculatus]|uniref:ERI1 exoribonuclease 2 n=1 Tax=Portunus trituberculatus TaxID=210409 RepID=A0A5B7D7U1_PORTR|nr:ERI1 exoribonuclease 2 [Portunus trituberculatus]
MSKNKTTLVRRELGLVQMRQMNVTSKKLTVEQEFQYLVVLDFESTCWEGKWNAPEQEIIEFPAVLLNLQSGEVISEFQQYVMPMEQPVLSPFCTSLTGITQEQVDAGVPLGTSIYLFSKWLQSLCEQHKLSFCAAVPGNRATFATWSDWDLEICLQRECTRKRIRKPEFFNQWADVKLLYKKFYQRKPKGLAGALQDLGLTFQGREHSGISDARNTATLISRMSPRLK